MIDKPLEKSADILMSSEKMIRNRSIAKEVIDVADNLRLFKYHTKSYIDSECLLKMPRRFKLDIIPFNLNNAVSTALKSFIGKTANSDLHFNIDIHSGVPVLIHSDMARFL